MKYKLFIILALFLNNAEAQNDTKTIRLEYDVYHLIDSTNTNSYIRYEMIVFINGAKVFFESKNQLDSDSISVAMKKTLENQKGGNIVFDQTKYQMKIISPLESFKGYSDYAEKRYAETNTILFDRYIIKDSITPIKWELTDTFKVLNYKKNQLATTQFKGRKWNVWFSSEIPISYGPWRLYGLPGLIIEAIDQKNQISFTLKNISYSSDSLQIDFKFDQKKYIAVTRKKFMKIAEAFTENPSYFFKSQSGIDLDKLKISDNNTSGRNRRLPPVNNPIELE